MALTCEPAKAGPGAYQVSQGTLDECISAFMEKPAATRHLYEIHTAPQPPLVTDILSPEHVTELSRLQGISLKASTRKPLRLLLMIEQEPSSGFSRYR